MASGYGLQCAERRSTRSIAPAACLTQLQVVGGYPASVLMVGDVALNEVNLNTSTPLPKLLCALTGQVELTFMQAADTRGNLCHVCFVTWQAGSKITWFCSALSSTKTVSACRACCMKKASSRLSAQPLVPPVLSCSALLRFACLPFLQSEQ